MLIPVAWVNETIYTMFFLLLSVHMTMLLVEQPTMKAAAGLGVAMGLGALFRSTLLPQFGLSAAWIIWSHLRDKRPLPLKHVATATVVFLLVLAPWTIRNYRVFGKIIPVSQNLGVNLWCGWNPHASGSECLMDGGRMLHEPALMKQLQAATSEPEIDRLYKQSAFDAASADPSRWLKQRLFSFLFFWHEHSFWAPKSPFHTLGWRLIGLLNLPFLALFFVGVAGVIRKNGLMRYVLLVMSGHCLIHTLIHAGIGSRFRYQIEPLMLIVIATFLVSRWPSLGDRLERWKGSLVISPR
jgi:4-amino-4-deoxy-L-arabinose transferase-like glycosyltransferase